MAGLADPEDRMTSVGDAARLTSVATSGARAWTGGGFSPVQPGGLQVGLPGCRGPGRDVTPRLHSPWQTAAGDADRRSWICGVESAADLRVRQSVGAGGELSLPMLLLGRAARLPAQLRAFFGTVIWRSPQLIRVVAA